MKNKILLISFVMIFLMGIGMVSADLGTFNQNDCVPIVTSLNATSVNITILTSPSPSPHIILQNVQMAGSNGAFNYTFCNTSIRGVYTYGYQDNYGNTFSNSFTVGDNGITILLILGFLTIILFMFGYFAHNIWFVYISGLLALVFGVYDIINGFAYINDVYTQSVGYVAIGFGIIFFVMAAYEQFIGDDDSGGEE